MIEVKEYYIDNDNKYFLFKFFIFLKFFFYVFSMKQFFFL